MPKGGLTRTRLKKWLVGIVFQGDREGTLFKQPRLQILKLVRGCTEA
jgi:hypothetical protein